MLALALSLSLAAAADPLVGVWLDGKEPFIELRADGTGVLGTTEMTWEKKGQSTLLVTEKGDPIPRELEVVVKGDAMTLQIEEAELKLKRKKPKKK